MAPYAESIPHSSAPCEFFPRFMNGMLNLAHGVVSVARRVLAALPAPFSGILASVLLLVGVPLAILLIHLPLVLGVSVLCFVVYSGSESGFGLGLLAMLAGFVTQIVLAVVISFRVRRKAGEGAVRVYNSYLEVVGNSMLFIVAFLCLFTIGAMAKSIMEKPEAASGGDLQNGIIVSLFALLFLSASTAILIHSCWKRNQHLGWKTAFAVFLAKSAVTWVSWLAVNRIFTAIDRILHPVSEKEAALNRRDNKTTARNAHGSYMGQLSNRTQATNVVGEAAVAGILFWILKVTIDPLVTRRPDDEPGGFGSAMRDFKTWSSRHVFFLLFAVLSMAAIAVGGQVYLLPKLGTKLNLASEKRYAEEQQTRQAQFEEKVQAEQAAKKERDLEENALEMQKVVCAAVAKAIGKGIPGKAVPPVGAFESSDTYLAALLKKGCFSNLVQVAATTLCGDHRYEGVLRSRQFIEGEADDGLRPAPTPERYAEAFEKSGLFSATAGGLPPILRIWRTLAGGLGKEYETFGGREEYPLLYTSNLDIPLKEMMREESYADEQKWGKFVREGTASFVVVIYSHKENDRASYGQAGKAKAIDRDQVTRQSFFDMNPHEAPTNTEDFEILNPSTPFDPSILERLVQAAREAEMADVEAAEQAKADEKKAKAKEAMAFFDDEEKEEAKEESKDGKTEDSKDESSDKPTAQSAKPEPTPQPAASPTPPVAPSAQPAAASAPAAQPVSEERLVQLGKVADQIAEQVRAGKATAEAACRQVRMSAKMTNEEKAMFLDMLARRGIVEGTAPSSSAVVNESALAEANHRAEEANRRAEEAEAKRRNEVDEARRETDELKRQLDEVKRQAADAMRQAADAMRQADEAKRQAREAEKNRQTEVQALKRQLTEAETRVSTANSQKDAAENKVTTLQTQLDDTKKQLQAALQNTMQNIVNQQSEVQDDEDEDLDEDVGPAPILRGSGERRGVTPKAGLDDAENLRLREARLREAELLEKRKEEEAKRRAEIERLREEKAARKAEAERIRQKMAQQEAAMEAEMGMPTVGFPSFPGAGTAEPSDTPSRGLGNVVTFPQPQPEAAVPDAMVTQLAQGILLSIQTGQMTASQASMILSQAMLTEGQKAKVREILASYGISLAK